MMNRQQLIEHNLNLVYFLVNKYYPSFIQDEDIIQCGMLGLCRAADTWDESKSLFSTYAGKCICNEICKEFKNRKKSKGLLSLDYEIKEYDGNTKLRDLIEGESDVDFMDEQPFIDTLSEKEKEIYLLLRDGLEAEEIIEKLGMTQTTLDTYIRRLRLQWRNFYGD